MNKSEQHEVDKLCKYSYALDKATWQAIAARSISALIRSSLRSKSRDALMAKAESWGITSHPEFIIHSHFA